VITFSDPDGLQLELVTGPSLGLEKSWQAGPIPLEYAIHGFHSATLSEEGYEQTASLLTETLGFRLIQREGNRFRYAAGSGQPGSAVDVICTPDDSIARVAVGTVHHSPGAQPMIGSKASGIVKSRDRDTTSHP